MKAVTRSRTSAAVVATLAILYGTLVYADHHPDSASSTDAPTVLITGANRGLGLEFARQYSADGWNVIGTARNPEQADELGSLPVEVAQLDVADAASIAGLAESLEGRPIDLLINNAGIFPRVNKLEEINFDDYSRTIAVNTLGPVRVTRALLPNLRLGDKKTIVNITSRLGSIALNDFGVYYGYRESKAALNMFTKTLAVELAPEGFTCLTVHPGWVKTDMGGENANLTPQESISGMRAVIQKIGPAKTGTYWSYSGEEVPW
ncbi:MAG: SDR family oxidoreductase [Gammaproteobacteria bacterium]|nr:SDR family oxidoreductase [Gammaproteobacteria bacterium]NNL44465.1 SDR family oxidoreductase [Woeseiaceae bacterium]